MRAIEADDRAMQRALRGGAARRETVDARGGWAACARVFEGLWRCAVRMDADLGSGCRVRVRAAVLALGLTDEGFAADTLSKALQDSGSAAVGGAISSVIADGLQGADAVRKVPYRAGLAAKRVTAGG